MGDDCVHSQSGGGDADWGVTVIPFPVSVRRSDDGVVAGGHRA